MNYQNIIEKAKILGFTEVELFIKTNETNNITLHKGNVDSFDCKTITGLSIRALKDNKMGYVYTESFEEEDLDLMLNNLVENTNNLNSTKPEFIFDGKAEYDKVINRTCNYNDYTFSDKKNLLEKLEKDLYSVDKRIINVQCVYVENRSTTRIVNSKGMDLAKNFEYILAYAMVVTSDNNETKSGFGLDINFDFNKIDTNKIIKDATYDSLNSLGAGFVSSGSYPVVFSRNVASDILGAFSSIFSGTSAMDKMTSLLGKENTKIFGDNITLIDDPFNKKAINNVSFDDEGIPCHYKEVVTNGVFNGFLHSQQSANFFNTNPTGNGFKASAQSAVSVSPVNLTIKEGQHSKDEIIATIDKGIYVSDVAGLHAGLNTISGDFNLQSSGYLIEDGKLSSAVTLFVISGNFFDMMNNIDMIGNDIIERFDSIASPTLKVKSLSISGK